MGGRTHSERLMLAATGGEAGEIWKRAYRLPGHDAVTGLALKFRQKKACASAQAGANKLYSIEYQEFSPINTSGMETVAVGY